MKSKIKNYYFDNKEFIELNENNNYILYFNYFLKISIFLFFLSIKYINIESKIIVNIDNNIEEKVYEKNINFSEYSTNIKTIAMYYPDYQCIQENYNKTNILLNEWTYVNQAKPLFESHHQPRKPGDKQNYLEYYNLSEPETILKQIELAKSHGIYGFGIYYYWFSGKKLFEKTIDIFLENKNINFPFLLIWKNENFKRIINNNILLIKQNYNKINIDKFINDIKKYLISKNYIKIDGKPVLGINDITKIKNLKGCLLILREKARLLKIGEIFILALFKKIKDDIIQLLDGFYELPPTLFYKYQNLKKDIYYYYYSTLMFDFEIKNKTNSTIIFKGNVIEWDNTPEKKNSIIYNEYSPLKFYNSNKILIDWINNNLNSKNKFFFINSWNNWLEGSYLEPDENYGYASINALSKALFNLKYDNKQYNLFGLAKESLVLVLIHILQGDRISNIINKINNIPVKFDLIISTEFLYIKKMLEEQIIKFSKANLCEIIFLKNIKKSKVSLLIKLEKKIKYYKYFIHLSYKESKNSSEYDNFLIKYLYQNLLGSNEIVSKILTDFENNEHLGFIYPENFYFDRKLPMLFSKNIESFINSIIKRIYPGYIAGNNFKYPLGNMFWARVNAVYQIFEHRFIKFFSEEIQKVNNETVKVSEIIWLYLVKINGYYYKTIFNGF